MEDFFSECDADASFGDGKREEGDEGLGCGKNERHKVSEGAVQTFTEGLQR